MDRDRLNALLARFARGELAQDELVETLARLPFQTLEDARIDTHRALRNGVPEVVLGLGKTADQLVRIVRTLRDAGGNVLVTRVTPEQVAPLAAEFPGLELSLIHI